MRYFRKRSILQTVSKCGWPVFEVLGTQNEHDPKQLYFQGSDNPLVQLVQFFLFQCRTQGKT